MEKVRIGIIGPSWWVNYWHLPALLAHPQAVIVAVCGARERPADEVRDKYGAAAESFTDIDTMLDTARPDGVIVCTPNDMHYPAAMAALRRGIAVTCEKPLALDATQAREMADMARLRGVVGMTNFPYRDNPAVLAFREQIQAGFAGQILHVSGQYHGGFGLRRPPGWRGIRERSGAGILGDLGSHLIDLVRFITGDEFSSVCAHTLTTIPGASDMEVRLMRTEDPAAGLRNDDSCAFLAELASGAQGIFHTSWVAYQGALAQHQEIEVYGTLGRLHWTASHAGTRLRGLKAGQTHWETLPAEGAMAPDSGRSEDEDFFRPGRKTPTNTTYRWIDAIRDGKPAVSPDLEDGWRAQQVIDGVIQASRERRWVDVV